MERLLTAAACGLLAAAAFGVLGAVFGGAVRVMAKLRDRIPDATIGEALRKGVRGGAGFLAVAGGLVGILVGLIEPSAQDSMATLRASFGAAGIIMLLIGVGIGVPTTVLVWLALRYHRRHASSVDVAAEGEEKAAEPGSDQD